ncbi:MAG: preprotein translocase subunit SecG [Zoogloeaceae bacterium]|jgi:preprotein translocase subunit SecG|nr:preprotein translocase subunit SecG [Zoogloeaceae bacterium]
MNWLLLVLMIHILAALGVIGLVLMQHGKGADMGAAFGSGASGSLFGSSGSANFLSHSTAVLAAVFFLTSLGLAHLSFSAPKSSGSIMEGVVQSAPPASTPPAVTDEPVTEGEAQDAAASRADNIPQ